ncbi:ABC transporter permease [Paenibacillus sp. TRM 82003]|nr:ABC transporter permease [Paenibacillus sp. TRM 82003]
MKLLLKFVRDVKQATGQIIALALIIAVGAFFYAGLNTYSNSLSAYTDEYYKNHALADIYVHLDQISIDDVTGFREIEGVATIEGRYTFDAAQVFEGNHTTIKIHSIPVPNKINTPTIIEGRFPSVKGEVLVDSHYAKAHRLQVGDPLRVHKDDIVFTFTISGLCENVEYVKKNDIQDHESYGFAYMAEETIPEFAAGFFYNEMMIDAEEGYDSDKITDAVEKHAKQEKLALVNHITKERTFGYSKINETIYNNKMMSKVIPFVLFVIQAIILFLAMSRIIDAQRKQVGIMKALGVKHRAIILHYMGYPVLASILGSILGCVLAGFIFIPFVTESSARSYALPGITFSLSIFSVLPSILFSSAFGILSCYVSIKAIVKEHAAQAMRPKPPKTARPLFIERVPGLWNRIPYRYKLILRNISLNKQKALTSSIGVVVSTVLLITAFGTQTALLKVAGQVEEVYRYDLKVDYPLGTSLTTIKLPSGIKDHYSLSTYPVEFIKGDRKENATLVVTEIGNHLIRYFDKYGNGISLENGGALVPQSYADKYQISKGDTIQLSFTAPEHKHIAADMVVLDISTQYSNPSFYATPDYMSSFGIDDRPTSLIVEAIRSSDVHAVRQFFEQDDRVEGIADKTDLKQSADYIVKQNNFVFIMFIVCAVILSFGAIYTISSINIYERNRELATFKVLGYQRKKVNGLIFLENMILTVLAICIALPVSGYVYGLIVKALSSAHQQIPDRLTVSTLLFSIAVSLFLTMLSNGLLSRKVAEINMIESLKSIE